jgi:uncharacterized damage-inducible protein DinB
VNEALLDGFRHNAWATRKLLEFCRGLNDEQLNAVAVGSYGSITLTLKHMLGAEASYSFVFSGRFPVWDWKGDDVPQSISEMEGWEADLAAFWEDLLSHPLDTEAVLVARYDGGAVREVKTGIVLAQALHHGNVHREQVCTILTTLGVQPPDLDVWVYGNETRRHSLRQQ